MLLHPPVQTAISGTECHSQPTYPEFRESDVPDSFDRSRASRTSTSESDRGKNATQWRGRLTGALTKTVEPRALLKKPAGFLLGSRAPPCRERPTVSKPARCRNSGISGACRPEPPGRGCRRRPTLPQRRIAGRPRGLLRKFRNIRKPPIRRFQTCLRDRDALSRKSCFAMVGNRRAGDCRSAIRSRHPCPPPRLARCESGS